MGTEVVATLVDLGITGIFILYLVWANKQQSTRLDEYVQNLLSTLKELEEHREVGYEAIRDRYDGVIKRYNEERDKLLNDIIAKVDKLDR